MGFDGFGKEHFLGKEPVEQRHTCHGGTRHHGERGCIGHRLQQAAQPAHIARAGFMVDNAGRHEKRRLEDCMIDHVEDCSHRRKRASKAQKNCDEAKIADGRIGKQPFQILLEHRKKTGDQQADKPGPP
ncbi:Uncharacterised protein [Brucella neotomae]|nr:Uncharacterised protein [Brucella neotomae]